MSNKCCEKCRGLPHTTTYPAGRIDCPCHAPKNVLTDIKPDRLKELRESGVEITEVAPKEEEWEKEFAKLWREGEARGYDTYDPIKLFIQTHFIPKERVEKWRAEIEKKKPILWNDNVNRHIENIARANTLDEVLSLLSEDK